MMIDRLFCMFVRDCDASFKAILYNIKLFMGVSIPQYIQKHKNDLFQYVIVKYRLKV